MHPFMCFLSSRLACAVGRSALVALLLQLAACATPPTPATTRPQPVAPGASAEPAPSLRPRGSLEVERRWLQDWFKGTPVVISAMADGALSVTVPRAHCFDAGRSVVKPALAAVLDKVAESLRRQDEAQLQLISAPGDKSQDAALSVQRAQRVRAHLRSRGVPEARLGPPTRTDEPAVRLRLALPQH